MKTKIPCDRRTFIKGVAIFGGLAALFGLGRPAAGRQQPEKPTESPSRGYRLTEQVKKYYETARL